ncbi:hypothetical protein [Geobacter sp. SVR]|uniref:hypothetical protein n=1 Tax=Geobacter sp. SVR TaxID=2495594 RepID=UPI0015672E0B|nr:hypothetical protein [Geobacter sp. SVR]
MTDSINDDTPEWDALCHQCGRCCFEKLEDARGRIIYTQNACRYLDVITRRCKIFGRRFEINPECVKLTPELVPQLHWLPRDCAYRPPAAKYKQKERRDRRKRQP